MTFEGWSGGPFWAASSKGSHPFSGSELREVGLAHASFLCGPRRWARGRGWMLRHGVRRTRLLEAHFLTGEAELTVSALTDAQCCREPQVGHLVREHSGNCQLQTWSRRRRRAVLDAGRLAIIWCHHLPFFPLIGVGDFGSQLTSTCPILKSHLGQPAQTVTMEAVQGELPVSPC